jgi:hypothetical protein
MSYDPTKKRVSLHVMVSTEVAEWLSGEARRCECSRSVLVREILRGTVDKAKEAVRTSGLGIRPNACIAISDGEKNE